MLLTTYELVALRYVGQTYLQLERLVTREHHNSERRLRILKRLHEEVGTFETGAPIQPWLEMRQTVLVALRAEVRRELICLLEPLLPLEPESDEREIASIDSDLLFGTPLASSVIAHIKESKKGERLSELGLDVLELAGRQIELESLLQETS